jgi:hypothetical protein
MCTTRGSRPFFLALALLLCGAACEASDGEWLIRPYYYFVHWLSMGDLDLALDQFADDAVVVSGPGCLQTSPCVGRAAIREGYLAWILSGRIPLPVVDQRLDGERLSTHGEVVTRDPGHGHVVRLRGSQVFEFRAGRIASIRTELDTSDSQTAAYVARHAARDKFAHAP